MSCLLIETIDFVHFDPISRTRFLWDITMGIYTARERFTKKYPDLKFFTPRFNRDPEKLLEPEYTPMDEETTLVINSQFIPSDGFFFPMNTIGITPDGEFCYLRAESIRPYEIESICNGDIQSLFDKYETVEQNSCLFFKDFTDLIKINDKAILLDLNYIKNDTNYIASGENTYVDKTAKIQQFVFLNGNDGPIVIDKGSVIRPFSIIDGPCYIGKDCLIDSAKIRSGTTIKHRCKIGGEVESSVFESFSNKHHEGFIGHSYIGQWVNIGAMTTTSDLKNNYGSIRVKVEDKEIDTGLIKFGSVICDYSKLGIGMMLNTGTIISHGCNLFLDGHPLPKYIPPFRWGSKDTYEMNRFLTDLDTMMKRRNQSLSEAQRQHLAQTVLKKK